MSEETKYIIFDNRGSFIENIQREVIHVGIIFFAMWVAQDGPWLAFLFGFIVLALHWMDVKLALKWQKKFTSKLELQGWVNSREDDK